MATELFDRALKIIELKGGKCLTLTPPNSRDDKILIECKYGHKWATSNSRDICKDRWCKICLPVAEKSSKNKLKIKLDKIKNFCLAKNGECLAIEYFGKYIKMPFKCEKGHIWNATWARVRDGSWCKICKPYYNQHSKKYSLKDVQDIAKQKLGKCLSTEYKKRMMFRCNFGHEWEAEVGNIIGRNSWCPECDVGLYERITRVYFETIFNKKFPSSRPKWLKTSRNTQMELDGYCKELSIAFEHQGLQHYSNANSFTKKEGSFERIQENDKEKEVLCAKNNVKLIAIKQLDLFKNQLEILSFLKREFDRLNVDYPDLFSLKIDLSQAYNVSKFINRKEEIDKIIKTNNGNIVKQSGLLINDKTEVQCNICKYIWLASNSSILNKKWVCKCKQRTSPHKLSIKDAKNLAKSKHGKCLSTVYIRNNSKLEWECALGHRWLSTYNNIQKCWCPICAKSIKNKCLKIEIEAYKQIAIKKGGECLSNTVNSCFDKLEWKCSKGHIWLATANIIKNHPTRWCPKCYKLNRKLKK